MIYTDEEGLAAVMFPVEGMGVFAETEPVRRDRIAGTKATVKTDTRRMLSGASRSYTLLENQVPLDLARRFDQPATAHPPHA